MDMNRFFRFVCILGLLALTACGTSSGDSVSVVSTETFQLRTGYENYAQLSGSSSFSLSGVSSGFEITGSGTLLDSSLTADLFEGINCFRKNTTFSGTMYLGSQIVPIANTSSVYFDDSYNLLGTSSVQEYSVINDGFTIPQTAKVNDTGIIFTETTYASSAKLSPTGTKTWSYLLEQDTAETALLKIIVVKKDTLDRVITTKEESFIMTPSGSLTRLSISVVSNSDNLYYEF